MWNSIFLAILLLINHLLATIFMLSTETCAPSQYKGRFSQIGDSHVKDKSQDRLIFNIEIHILVRWHFYIDTTPCAHDFFL